MRIISTKIGIAFICGLVVLVGIAIGVSVYLDSDAFRRVALEKVNAALDGHLSISGHRLSITSGRLILTGIRLERSDRQPLAVVERLEVGIALPALMQHVIHVRMLQAENVRVYLTLDHDDRLLLTGLRERSSTDSPGRGEEAGAWNVKIDNFRLNNGELIFQRPSKGWSGRVVNIRINGDLDVGNKRGAMRLATGPLVWTSEITRSLPALTVEARYNGERPSTISIETARSSLKAGGRLLLEGDAPRLDVTAQLNLALDEVRPWIPADIRLEGLASARITARGRPDDPWVGLQLNLPQGILAGLDVAPLNAALNYHKGRVSVTDVDARGRWGTLKASGGMDPSAGRIEQAVATLTSANLGALGAALGIELPSGSGSVKLNCRGPWERPTAHMELMAQTLEWRQHHMGRLLTAADLDASGVVTFSHLVLENQGSLVEGKGRIFLQRDDGRWRKDPGLDLALEIQALDLSDFELDLPVSSLINADLKVGGTFGHLRGRANLTGSSVRWSDQVVDMQGAALWEDGRLDIPELTLSKNRSILKLHGRMELRQSGTGIWREAPLIKADLRSAGARIEDFFPDCSGPLTLEARVEGIPTDLSGSYRLTGSDLDLVGQPLTAAVAQGRLAGKVVYLDTVSVAVASGQQLQGRGMYGFDQQFEVSLKAAGIGLEHIPALQRAYPVKGLLAFSLEGRGSLANPLVKAEMTVRQPEFNGQPWEDFHLLATLRQRELDVDADLNFKVRAHSLLSSGDFNLTADLPDTELSPYLAMAGGSDWSGRLSARLQADGNWRRPQDIRAELEIAQALLRYQSLDLLSVRRLEARLHNGKLEVPAARLALMQNGFLNFSASGDLGADVHLTADGRLPLVALAPFSDRLTGAKGELVLQAQADGLLNRLQWQADVNLNGIGIELPELDQDIEDLNGRLRLTPHELTVEQVAGRVNGGRFTLGGSVALENMQPSGGRLVLNAQSLPIQWPQTMDVVVNGELTLESDDKKSVLSGRVVLLEGTYYKDVRLNLLSAVGQPKRAESVPTVSDLPPWLADIDLNVSLTHRYPLLVDNNLARLQVAPDLKLTGTLGRPVMSGRAHVTEGEIIFRRKTFTVKRGVVDFINPYKIEPNLDIAAEAQIRQWLVTLRLSGTPDRMAFELSSDPQESESDILSLILVGRTSSELAGGQGGGGQSTRQMLAALVATAWGEDVKKQTGVDILEVDTGTETSEENADTIQVTVGKRLSRRLTVKYEVESGSEELVQRAVSEYRFLEHLLASGFQDSSGGYGGELLFRIEF